MASQAMPPRLDSAMDYSRQYPPPPGQQANYHGAAPYNHQNLPPIHSYYEALGAPILPPLRLQNDPYGAEDYRLSMQRDQLAQQAHRQQQQQQAPKEEKATGGVSAKLDYDMDRMTDFVSEVAQGMYGLHLSGIRLADIDVLRSIKYGVSVQPPFRKWVAQVLAATRLPSATILLSLHYLTVRMKELPETVGQNENEIYRLLAVSMILGSKFLDDNTFINRSWSDVTGIKVSELNIMELEWLTFIGFNLHTDITDPNGIQYWLHAWKEHDASMDAKVRSMKLSPLDTNVPRNTSRRADSGYHSSYAKPAYANFTPASSAASTSYRNTPFMSADPWNRQDSATADMWTGQNRYYDNADHYGQAQAGASFHRNSLPPLQNWAPTYYSPWNQMSRTGAHGQGCTCLMCNRPYHAHAMGFGYAPQTVVG